MVGTVLIATNMLEHTAKKRASDWHKVSDTVQTKTGNDY